MRDKYVEELIKEVMGPRNGPEEIIVGADPCVKWFFLLGSFVLMHGYVRNLYRSRSFEKNSIMSLDIVSSFLISAF